MKTTSLRAAALVLSACTISSAYAQGTWTTVTLPAGCNPVTTAQMLDGTILMGNDFSNTAWYKLAPNATGSYTSPVVTAVASAPINRLYYGYTVLTDGRFVACGGEYISGSAVWTNQCHIYNPKTNAWATVTPPAGWTGIGDPPNLVTPDGKFHIGNAFNNKTAIFQPATLNFIAGPNKIDNGSEEGPVQCWDDTFVNPMGVNSPAAEKYNPATNTWIPAGTLPTPIFNSRREPGAGSSCPNSDVFFTGSLGQNVIYKLPAIPSAPGSWVVGPAWPTIAGTPYGAEDAMVAPLPNGKILCVGAPITSAFASGAILCEYNYATNTFTQVTGYPGAASDPAYVVRLLCLPTGQILLTNGDNAAYVYTPTNNTPNDAWRPTIVGAPSLAAPSMTFTMFITNMNGWTQGANYGDEGVSNTNYPVVRFRNLTTGNVYYGTTHDHSTFSIKQNNEIRTTKVDVPSTVPTGNYEMFTTANGTANKVGKPITIVNPGFLTKIAVNLQNWLVTRLGQVVNCDLVNAGGTVLETRTAMLDGSGNGEFTSSNNPAGLRIRVKGTHWLSDLKSITAGGPTPVSLNNGDVDGDNVVSVFDYIFLSDAFDSSAGDPNWLLSADLDGDGTVSVFDYIILSDNFDKVGI